MGGLERCSGCQGFVPGAMAACPHCGAEVRRLPGWARGLLMAASAGVACVTLSACYGAAALCEYPDGGEGRTLCTDGTTTSSSGSSGTSGASGSSGSSGSTGSTGSEDGGPDAGP